MCIRDRAAITEASGIGVELDDDGRNRPEAVFDSGLKRCTSTRSRRGTTDLMLRIVEAADCKRHVSGSMQNVPWRMEKVSEDETCVFKVRPPCLDAD